MIGWYHTGPKLRASDLEINDLLKRYIARPVMVIVDVRPHTVGIPTDAYFAVEEIKDVRQSPTSFHVHTLTQTFAILGRNRNPQDIPPRPLSDRSRRSRRDRCRAPPPRHQRLYHHHSRHPSFRTTRFPPWSPITDIRHPKIPRRRRSRQDARQPSNCLPPPRRTELATGSE